MFCVTNYDQCYEKIFSNIEKNIDTTPQTAIMNNISYPRESRTYETLHSNWHGDSARALVW